MKLDIELSDSELADLRLMRESYRRFERLACYGNSDSDRDKMRYFRLIEKLLENIQKNQTYEKTLPNRV